MKYIFNEQKKNFEKKVINLNNYLKENIEINENEVLKEIVNIIKKISMENGIDIVFSDEQYFLSSDSIDVSVQIYNSINNLNLDLDNHIILYIINNHFYLYLEFSHFWN